MSTSTGIMKVLLLMMITTELVMIKIMMIPLFKN